VPSAPMISIAKTTRGTARAAPKRRLRSSVGAPQRVWGLPRE